jgi:glycyl-tRNA synthetase
MREFEQMEMQYFVRPEAEATAAFEMWLPARRAWYERYGVTPARLRLREHAPDELAHYAKKAVDVEYRFPFGWKELEGVHNRGDFDLSRHSEASGEKLEYFDQATDEHVFPWVVETAAGADRASFTFLIDAYREEGPGEGLWRSPGRRPTRRSPAATQAARSSKLCPSKDDLKRHTAGGLRRPAAIGKLYRRQDRDRLCRGASPSTSVARRRGGTTVLIRTLDRNGCPGRRG